MELAWLAFPSRTATALRADWSAVRSAAHDLLERYGCVVETAPNGAQAMFMVRNGGYDAVIADIRLPDMNGEQVFRRIANLARVPPVLFVTAYPESFTMRSAEVAGMWRQHFTDGSTDILYKPFEIEVLYEKIEGLIGPSAEGSE